MHACVCVCACVTIHVYYYMGGRSDVHMCVCVNRARRFQVKKLIRTSYNMIDELTDQSIVNKKIIERVYNFSHS